METTMADEGDYLDSLINAFLKETAFILFALITLTGCAILLFTTIRDICANL
jgi:hypothetical protein